MNDDVKTNAKKGHSGKGRGVDEEGSFFNKVRSDAFKRKVESKLKEGVFKNLVSELKMPREIVTHLISQIDETKQAALGVISREVRLFFEHTNLADEMAHLLSQLSFEVTTKVRFVQNDRKIQPEPRRGAETTPPPSSTDTAPDEESRPEALPRGDRIDGE